LIVSAAFRVTPAYVADIVTDVLFDGRVVLIANVPVVAPAATVMLAGGAASAGTLLFNVTSAPVEGAGADSVTVALTGVPPTTLVLLRVRVESLAVGAAAGLTVNVAVFWTPL
jgi:hypothetical protein